MWRADSLESSPMLQKIEGRRRGYQRMRRSDGTLMQLTWTWAHFGSWWWTGKPGVLQSVGSRRVGHGCMTEEQQRQDRLGTFSLWKESPDDSDSKDRPENYWRDLQEGQLLEILSWSELNWLLFEEVYPRLFNQSLQECVKWWDLCLRWHWLNELQVASLYLFILWLEDSGCWEFGDQRLSTWNNVLCIVHIQAFATAKNTARICSSKDTTTVSVFLSCPLSQNRH